LDINKTADTQCMDKYNAYSRCYKDIVDDPNTTFLEAGETSNVLEELLNTRKKKPVKQVNFWMSKVHCNCYLKFIKILTRCVSFAVYI
jgi:hypothetical protein